MSTEDLTVYGGEANNLGQWDFGWIPPDKRDTGMVLGHNLALSYMPKFSIKGGYSDTGEAKIYDLAKKANNGENFCAFYQQTGSCVGNGGGNAVWYLSAMEKVRLKDPERVTVPFWLIPYGKSRELAGMRGPGEGSLGSTFARAIAEFGIVAADEEGLPQWSIDPSGDGITWGAREEKRWSDGAAIPQSWLEKSRQHIVKTVAPINTSEQGTEALLNFYPLTIASSWGGQMRCRVENGVLMNRRSGTWNHQMSVIAYWKHPQQGEIYYVMNSWGRKAHGECPSGAPPGGFWISKKDFDWICRNGEVFAFSQFQGFPAQELAWYF